MRFTSLHTGLSFAAFSMPLANQSSLEIAQQYLLASLFLCAFLMPSNAPPAPEEASSQQQEEQPHDQLPPSEAQSTPEDPEAAGMSKVHKASAYYTFPLRGAIGTDSTQDPVEQPDTKPPEPRPAEAIAPEVKAEAQAPEVKAEAQVPDAEAEVEVPEPRPAEAANPPEPSPEASASSPVPMGCVSSTLQGKSVPRPPVDDDNDDEDDDEEEYQWRKITRGGYNGYHVRRNPRTGRGELMRPRSNR